MAAPGGFSLLYLEPQYAITDKKAIGACLAVYTFLSFGSASDRSLFGLTGDYYLATSRVRPSLGLMLGIYDQASGGVVPGIAPRVKLNVYRFVITYAAHLTEVPFSALNLSFYLGGSRY